MAKAVVVVCLMALSCCVATGLPSELGKGSVGWQQFDLWPMRVEDMPEDDTEPISHFVLQLAALQSHCEVIIDPTEKPSSVSTAAKLIEFGDVGEGPDWLFIPGALEEASNINSLNLTPCPKQDKNSYLSTLNGVNKCLLLGSLPKKLLLRSTASDPDEFEESRCWVTIRGSSKGAMMAIKGQTSVHENRGATDLKGETKIPVDTTKTTARGIDSNPRITTQTVEKDDENAEDDEDDRTNDGDDDDDDDDDDAYTKFRAQKANRRFLVKSDNHQK